MTLDQDKARLAELEHDIATYPPGERAAYANGFEAGTRLAYEECRSMVANYRDGSLTHHCREHLQMAMHALESLALDAQD